MGSLKILETKKVIVDEIVENIKNSKTIILADNKGITDVENKELRTNLKECDSFIKVYKNTLTKIAFKKANIEFNEEDFIGPKTIIFSKNVVEPAKVISDFSKNSKMEIKFGYIDGAFTDETTVKKLASIPPRDTLLTMLAASMLGVQKNLAISLDLLKEQK
ncbi:MAG: 50S ribosomal protein L10 [Bacilli bacterium]